MKNGEALRRVSDMQHQWTTLQRQLGHLEDKVRLVLSQHDPDNPHIDEGMMEMLDDDHSSHTSPLHSPPLHKADNGHHYGLQRVLSAGSSIPPPRQSLAPPQLHRPGSTTPNAQQRGMRRIPSRPSLPASSQTELPRWNPFTRPYEAPPTPPALRRPSHGSHSSMGTAGTGIRRPSQSGMPSGMVTPTFRRASSPTFSSPPMSVPRMPHMTPRKSMPNTPTLKSRTTPRQSFGASLGRPPPSAFRALSPAPSLPNRPSSRVSIGSAASSHVASVGMRPFTPSKYDMLDLEVQKVIDAVQPNIFIARLDQPLRRGQRKADGESWTGEFLFGAGERSTSVKLLELAGRGPPGAPKRVKVMVRVGGSELTRSQAESIADSSLG